MEMQSTPSSAIERRPPRPTLPETSRGIRPAVMRTASRRRSGLKSSSRMRSHPASRAWRSCARSSTSTTSGSAGHCRRAPATAAASEPAARMWFSFSITVSYRPKRWLSPPPQRTAYFCARRRPGRVLRASRMRVPVPATAAT
ncbi:hypothetical protein G6F22_020850 [Rhizopus arrhizus]|nr:hypothetical protein G6F22_020850 [Rhizopus arrhizus]